MSHDLLEEDSSLRVAYKMLTFHEEPLNEDAVEDNLLMEVCRKWTFHGDYPLHYDHEEANNLWMEGDMMLTFHDDDLHEGGDNLLLVVDMKWTFHEGGYFQEVVDTL